MKCVQITIQAKEDQQDILISELEEFGALGFEQSDESLIAYFNELDFDSYEINKILTDQVFETSLIEEKNWNEVWESNFQPVVVEGFCGIRAEFHPPIQNVEHEIIITPKMSFGTGHHATTYMMIAQMRELNFENKTVFDFGTGTGILSILAEKLGASVVTAIDIDEWSITNAHENIQENNCKKIDVALTTNLPQRTFDIILANINRHVILDYLPSLQNNLVAGSKVLLSGLMLQDEAAIIEACNKENLQLIRKTERNNWICLLFSNGL